MPFTGSHPAAVLPLLRVGLVPTGLVLGSLAPDVPYFVPLPLTSELTHSVLGVLTVDVALGVALLVVWQELLAPAGVAVAPAALRRRLAPGAPARLSAYVATPRAVLLLLVSFVVGAATHAGWDALTHEGTSSDAWGSARHGALVGHGSAQYASTALGALALAGWATAWWRRAPRRPTDRAGVPQVRPAVSVASVALVVAATALGALVGAVPPLVQPAQPDFHVAAVLAATHGGAAGGAAAVLVAAAVLLLVRRREPATAVRRG